MLPPIILDAGYFMPNRLFFDNMISILIYAVVGTVWNALTIGLSLWAIGLTGLYGVELPLLDTLLFSSIVSAVDPVAVLAVFEEIQVNEVLNILVFGESLLNDAVTVVLYHMFEGYTEMGQENLITIDYIAGVASFFVAALGGALIGIIWGVLAAFISRFSHHVRIIEPLFVFVLAYLAYLNAELFHLSGIVALAFCGITMKNYVEENISYKSHVTVKYTMKMLASSSETIIFLFLGVSTVNDDHEWNTWFVVMTILFCTLYRAIGVIIQTWFLNHFRLHKINKVEQFIMAYGGLRGAVAFALVLVISENVIPTKAMMVTTVIAEVYFTVFIQGMTIGPLVRILNVSTSHKTKLSMNERLHTRLMDYLMAGIEDISGHPMGNYHLRDKFKHYNNKYVRPFLTRDHHVREPKIFETYSKLNIADAMNLVQKNGNMLPTMGKDMKMSLSTVFRSYTQTSLPKPLSHSDSAIPHYDTNITNLDWGELEYSPSTKDLNDAELHHILSDAMFKPPLRARRCCRDQIDESTPHRLHHKLRLPIRHLESEKKIRKKIRKTNHQHVGRGSNCHHKAQDKKWKLNDLRPCKIRFNLPDNPSEKSGMGSQIKTYSPQSSFQTLTPEDEVIMFTVKSEDGEKSQTATPPISRTVTETTLPWKREDCVDESCVRRQQEFPPWIDNKDYHLYSSPTNTFLKKLRPHEEKTKDVFSIFELNARPSEEASNGDDDVKASAIAKLNPEHSRSEQKHDSVAIRVSQDPDEKVCTTNYEMDSPISSQNTEITSTKDDSTDQSKEAKTSLIICVESENTISNAETKL
ncbi:Na(+)/H(+) exchanger protein 2-like isoform X1 [Tachypleus tridentatus]|uniref:Na(+)/H(+) exchanger protein 2-like isoform X1 n=1 Tax=Tachypleus tridentatus TaxID=6853 RepID=UPI003FD34A29